MREQVFTAAIRRNESEALCIVEPLYCSSCHFFQSFKTKIIGSNPSDVSISRTGKYGVSATAKQPDRSCFSTCNKTQTALYALSPPGSNGRQGSLSGPKAANLAGKLGTNRRCARRQRLQFGAGEIARQRHHATIGAGLETVCRNEGERRPQGCRHLLGGFHLVGRNVDGPDTYALSREKAQKLERDP